MTIEDSLPVGFACPEGTSLLITLPNGATFSALIDGTCRVVMHVNVPDITAEPTALVPHDQVTGATITVSASAVKNEHGTLYTFTTAGAVKS